jgi:hypothetical protein
MFEQKIPSTKLEILNNIKIQKSKSEESYLEFLSFEFI